MRRAVIEEQGEGLEQARKEGQHLPRFHGALPCYNAGFFETP
jgi:hypothetical protein